MEAIERLISCYGSREDQFPIAYLFGAAGPNLWDNRAACGRIYEVTCASTGGVGQCTGATIQIKIVDGRLGPRAPDLTLSQVAAAKLYTGGGAFNIQFNLVYP